MQSYRTRPRTVQAVKFDLDVQPWPEGIQVYQDGYLYRAGGYLVFINPGDWVVDDDGERRVVRADIFPVVYEGVDV